MVNILGEGSEFLDLHYIDDADTDTWQSFTAIGRGR